MPLTRILWPGRSCLVSFKIDAEPSTSTAASLPSFIIVYLVREGSLHKDHLDIAEQRKVARDDAKRLALTITVMGYLNIDQLPANE